MYREKVHRMFRNNHRVKRGVTKQGNIAGEQVTVELYHYRDDINKLYLNVYVGTKKIKSVTAYSPYINIMFDKMYAKCEKVRYKKFNEYDNHMLRSLVHFAYMDFNEIW